MDVADQLLIDKAVFGQAVEINAVELFNLAYLEVKCTLGCQQYAVLTVVEPGQSALHLVFWSMLADVLELTNGSFTEALTLSRKALSLTYSK